MEPEAPAMHATVLPAGGTRLHPILALQRGWGTFTRHVGPSLGVMLALFVIYFAGELIPVVNLAVGLLAGPALFAGGGRWLVRTIRGESPTFGSVFDGFKRWPSVTGAILLVYLVSFLLMAPSLATLIATVGFAAFRHPQDFASAFHPAMIAPLVAVFVVCYAATIAWITRTWPVFFAVMEPDAPDAMTTVRRSWAMTRGNAWRSFGLFALGLPLELAGLLALCVGIIPAIAVWYFTCAHGYEMLRGTPAPPAEEPAAPVRPAL